MKKIPLQKPICKRRRGGISAHGNAQIAHLVRIIEGSGPGWGDSTRCSDERISRREDCELESSFRTHTSESNAGSCVNKRSQDN